MAIHKQGSASIHVTGQSGNYADDALIFTVFLPSGMQCRKL